MMNIEFKQIKISPLNRTVRLEAEFSCLKDDLTPFAEESVVISVNGQSIYRTKTDRQGKFEINQSVPAASLKGTEENELTAKFDNHDIVASRKFLLLRNSTLNEMRVKIDVRATESFNDGSMLHFVNECMSAILALSSDDFDNISGVRFVTSLIPQGVNIKEMSTDHAGQCAIQFFNEFLVEKGPPPRRREKIKCRLFGSEDLKKTSCEVHITGFPKDYIIMAKLNQ